MVYKQITEKRYNEFAQDKISMNNILHCPACGHASLWRKPNNHRKYVCSQCKKESIIIAPRKNQN